MTGTRQWNTGMVARGRIYFGADNRVYAFQLPAGTPTPTATATATSTAVPTATATATATATSTPTATATATETPTATPTATAYCYVYANTNSNVNADTKGSEGSQCNSGENHQLHREVAQCWRCHRLPVGCGYGPCFCQLRARVPEFGRRQCHQSKRYRADAEHELLLPVTSI